MLPYTGSMEKTIVCDDIKRFPLRQRRSLEGARCPGDDSGRLYHVYIELVAQVSKFAPVNVIRAFVPQQK